MTCFAFIDDAIYGTAFNYYHKLPKRVIKIVYNHLTKLM